MVRGTPYHFCRVPGAFGRGIALPPPPPIDLESYTYGFEVGLGLGLDSKLCPIRLDSQGRRIRGFEGARAPPEVWTRKCTLSTPKAPPQNERKSWWNAVLKQLTDANKVMVLLTFVSGIYLYKTAVIYTTHFDNFLPMSTRLDSTQDSIRLSSTWYSARVRWLCSVWFNSGSRGKYDNVQSDAILPTPERIVPTLKCGKKYERCKQKTAQTKTS